MEDDNDNTIQLPHLHDVEKGLSVSLLRGIVSIRGEHMRCRLSRPYPGAIRPYPCVMLILSPLRLNACARRLAKPAQ